MARARQQPKQPPKRKPKAAPRRQPKRILNALPSPERDEDWRIDTAEDAGVIAAAPRIPPRKDLRAAIGRELGNWRVCSRRKGRS